MGNNDTRTARGGRELIGWLVIVLGAGALQLPALGRMAMHHVDILQFELMYTSNEAVRQTLMLGADGLAAARQQLFIDFGYLVLYGITLWKACHLLGARAARLGPALVARLAPIFAWFAVATAICDAVENLGLLLVTYGHVEQPWPGLASGYATAKYVFLALTLAFLLLGVIATSVGRGRGPADVAPTETG
ncbi:MAG TPA: hypothetical protein VM093_09825 [Aeromicrobium sp.]|nr:hypothetical protein [Aeromicrobium sp.]